MPQRGRVLPGFALFFMTEADSLFRSPITTGLPPVENLAIAIGRQIIDFDAHMTGIAYEGLSPKR
jgi:hypothetical protein